MRPSFLAFLLILVTAVATPEQRPSDTAHAEIESFLRAGRFAEAEALARRVLADSEAKSGADSLETGEALDLLVGVLVESERTTGEDARHLAERAVRLRESLAAPDSPSLIDPLNNLGSVLRGQGALDEARTAHARALAVAERAMGPEHPSVADALDGLASTLELLADDAGAEPLFLRALAIRERTARETKEHADALNNLANVKRHRGQTQEARELLQRAAVIFERVEGPDGKNLSSVYGNLAMVHLDEHNRAEALALFDKALASRRRTLPEDHPLVAHAIHNVGGTLRAMGRYAQARPLLEQALALREEQLGRAHPEVGKDYRDLARVYWNLGDLSAAFAAELRAEQSARDHFRRVAWSLSERGALALGGSTLGLPLLLSVARLDDARAKEAFGEVVGSRALVFDEVAWRARVVAASSDPQIARLVDELAARSRSLSNLWVRGPDPGRPENYTREIEVARRALERAEAEVGDTSRAFRTAFEREAVTAADVLAALEREDALVSFVRHNRFLQPRDPTPGGAAGGAAKPQGASRRSEPVYTAIVVRAGEHDFQVVSLARADEIEERVLAWQREAARGLWENPERTPRDAEAACREAGRELRRAVWDPIVPHLGSPRRVFVVPDGALHLLNLAALPVEPRGYLVETGPALHVLASERDLVRLRSAPPRGRGLLAIGGAAFDAGGRTDRDAPSSPRPASLRSSSACVALQAMKFAPLPGSEVEVRRIEALFSTGAPSEPRRVLTAAGATEQSFKSNASGCRVLHLATHGFFLGAECPAAFDPMRDVKLTDARAADARAEPESPLLLTGLAFAGANHRADAAPDQDDGILMAQEVAALDLEGLEWVVLSACESGVGQIKDGEGVFGLRRAFQIAGAASVITSLWEVDDRDAKNWMSHLYQARLGEQASTVDAVRVASLRVIADRRRRRLDTHPSRWAAFVATGDWR